jgi:hypothetical protein
MYMNWLPGYPAHVTVQANHVRCFVTSADHTFHNNRAAFQDKLTSILDVIGAVDQILASSRNTLVFVVCSSDKMDTVIYR